VKADPPTNPTPPPPGIEEIGVSIEEPFSILALEAISDSALNNTRELKAQHDAAQRSGNQMSAQDLIDYETARRAGLANGAPAAPAPAPVATAPVPVPVPAMAAAPAPITPPKGANVWPPPGSMGGRPRSPVSANGVRQ
jgi:hypothetical protein